MSKVEHLIENDAKEELEEVDNSNDKELKAAQNFCSNSPGDFQVTTRSYNLTGFRAPPASPCSTFIGGRIQSFQGDWNKDDVNDEEDENVNGKDLLARRRGRKSFPHVSTLFDENKTTTTEDQQTSNTHLFELSQSSSTSSSFPSSSIFGFGSGPPPNSPEKQITNLDGSLNNSFFCLNEGEQKENQENQETSSTTLSSSENSKDDSILSLSKEEETQSSTMTSKLERASKLYQLKTQLHLTHRLEQICLNSNSSIEEETQQNDKVDDQCQLEQINPSIVQQQQQHEQTV